MTKSILGGFRAELERLAGGFDDPSLVIRMGEDFSPYHPEITMTLNDKSTWVDVADLLRSGDWVVHMLGRKVGRFMDTLLDTLSDTLSGVEGDALSKLLSRVAIVESEIGRLYEYLFEVSLVLDSEKRFEQALSIYFSFIPSRTLETALSTLYDLAETVTEEGQALVLILIAATIMAHYHGATEGNLLEEEDDIEYADFLFCISKVAWRAMILWLTVEDRLDMPTSTYAEYIHGLRSYLRKKQVVAQQDETDPYFEQSNCVGFFLYLFEDSKEMWKMLAQYRTIHEFAAEVEDTRRTARDIWGVSAFYPSVRYPAPYCAVPVGEHSIPFRVITDSNVVPWTTALLFKDMPPAVFNYLLPPPHAMLPTYPAYLFAYFDPDTSGDIYALASTPGLTRTFLKRASENQQYAPSGQWIVPLPENYVLRTFFGITGFRAVADPRGLWVSFYADLVDRSVVPRPLLSRRLYTHAFRWEPDGQGISWELVTLSADDARYAVMYNLLDMTLAAFWHDLVTGGPTVIRKRRRKQAGATKGHAKQRRSRRNAASLPRQRVVYENDAEESEAIQWGQESLGEQTRRRLQLHGVSGHLRRLQPHSAASEVARENAEAFGFLLPEGFTFVRPHLRGGEAEGAEAVPAERVVTQAQGLLTLITLLSE